MNLDASAFVADPQLVLALRQRATPVDCGRHRMLFRQGDHADGVYILHAGNVTLTLRSLSGEKAVSILAAPDSLLGLPAVLGGAEYSLSAAAHPGADVSFVSRESFANLMLTEPALSMMILRVLAAEVRTARIALSNC